MPSRQRLNFFVCTRHLANQAKAMFVFTIMASLSSILSFPANHQQVKGGLAIALDQHNLMQKMKAGREKASPEGQCPGRLQNQGRRQKGVVAIQGCPGRLGCTLWAASGLGFVLRRLSGRDRRARAAGRAESYVRTRPSA